jgi:hypothetical protein
MAMGAGLAPVAGLARSWASAPDAAANLCMPAAPGSLNLTRDLAYQGVFRYPLSDGTNTFFGFTNGAITGRRVGNNINLLVAGAWPWRTVRGVSVQDAIYEISYPGVGANVANSPRAELVRIWGDVYQGHRRTAVDGESTVRGLLWANDRLLWSYGYVYNTAGIHDPSIGASTLNNDGTVTSYGPWRTTAHSQKTRGYMTLNPNGQVGYGGPVTSGNHASAWGATLNVGNVPDLGRPPDTVGDSRRSIDTHPLIDHGMERKQRRYDTNFKRCGWNVIYDNSQGGFTLPGTDEFGTIDLISGAAWVKTTSKEGIICFGQMAQTIPGFQYGGGDTVTHYWYGPTSCIHGQDGTPVSGSTGDASGTSVLNAWVFDPSNPSVDPPPVPMRNLVPSVNRAMGLYQLGGAWFDAPSRLLFVSEGGADSVNPYESQPAIHVFRVAD